MLYYTRNPEVLQPALMEEVFGCQTPLFCQDKRDLFRNWSRKLLEMPVIMRPL